VGRSRCDASTPDILGSLSVTGLNSDGYNVLTGIREGSVNRRNIEIDSPNYEARDVSRLIDWCPRGPECNWTPRGSSNGMVGGSYGGASNS